MPARHDGGPARGSRLPATLPLREVARGRPKEDRDTVPYEIEVNGERHTIDAPADTPLLWVLRDDLGQTGTKYGCGRGLCGACTVHQDGRAIRSCQLTLEAAAGTSITTIEGLSSNGGHPVQRAWVDIDVPQCGYCQAGQIMSAAALLARTLRPDDAAIERALSGNLCRCGTYDRIRAAVRHAAELAAED
jgi:aerobic-type carbon monoxide dehydrogenase small subunit (CoxS/CutS family)